MLWVLECVKYVLCLIMFEDGVFCEIIDFVEQMLLNVLLYCIGYCEGWVVLVQNSWKLVLGVLLVMVVVLVLGYCYGLLWGVKVVVNMVLQCVEVQFGCSMFKVMDECWFWLSKLFVVQQDCICVWFVVLYWFLQVMYMYYIVFWDVDIGVNVFVLLGGDIVVIDVLVKLVGEGDGLMGVLVYEVGYVEYCYGL